MTSAGTAGAGIRQAPTLRRLPLGRSLEVPLRLGAHPLELVTALAAATPVISSTVKALGAGWMPAGDDGIIATRAWDVLSAHTPLVGQYSEAGLVIPGQVMHSPGPMLYWLIALQARFAPVWSLPVTICVLNTLCILGCVMLARRRGGLALMFATALGIALMCQSLATESLHDIWNPAAVLFPFLLLVFVCWSIACGDHRLLPLAALIASFVVQTHLVYALPAALLVVVAAAGLLARRLPRRPLRSAPIGAAGRAPASRVWPWALGAVVLAIACWSPPIVDEFEHRPGNLTKIVRTAEHRGPTLGASVGWHTVVRTVGVPPWWLEEPASQWQRKAEVRETPSLPRTVSAVVVLALLAVVGLLAVRVRRWDLAAAAAIGLGLTGLIGAQAAANPTGRLLSGTLGYTLWWGSEVGLWVWLTLVWGAWLGARAAAVRLGFDVGAGVLVPRFAGLVALVCVVAAGAAVASSARPDTHVYDYHPIRTIATGIERVIPPGRTIAYRAGPLDVATQPIEPAVRFLLVRHGLRPLADGALPRLGTYYIEDYRTVQWIVHLLDGTRRPRGMRLLARASFTGPWGPEVLSAWARQVVPAAPTASAASTALAASTVPPAP